LAAERGHVHVIKHLTLADADFVARDESLSTPLHSASKNGYVYAVEVLVAVMDDVNLQDRSGSTPLHRASSMGQLATVKVLLTHEADVRLRTKRGWTVLHFAAGNSHEDICKLLVEHGGRELWLINDESGLSPLDYSILNIQADDLATAVDTLSIEDYQSEEYPTVVKLIEANRSK
jgi:ankyrin repeat protein